VPDVPGLLLQSGLPSH